MRLRDKPRVFEPRENALRQHVDESCAQRQRHRPRLGVCHLVCRRRVVVRVAHRWHGREVRVCAATHATSPGSRAAMALCVSSSCRRLRAKRMSASRSYTRQPFGRVNAIGTNPNLDHTLNVAGLQAMPSLLRILCASCDDTGSSVEFALRREVFTVTISTIAGDDRSGLEDDPEKTVLQMKAHSKKHPCSRKDGMFTESNSGRPCVVLGAL